MSNIGKSRQERMETADYRFGWESAERGEPYPSWHVNNDRDLNKIENQRLGWSDYHDREKSL